MRKNNKMDMNIVEQLNVIAEKICDQYCKYPGIWDAEKEKCELCDSEHCRNCPLNELI